MLKLLTMVAIALVWYKAFIWMRLFEQPAYFINLLRKTITGIISFTLMLAILIGLLANVIYIIAKIEHTDDHSETLTPIFAQYFENDFMNAIMHMYLLALGEFDFGSFGERDGFTKAMMWIIFVFSTFILQITFMNMLIAIMGSVYGEVSDNKK